MWRNKSTRFWLIFGLIFVLYGGDVTGNLFKIAVLQGTDYSKDTAPIRVDAYKINRTHEISSELFIRLNGIDQSPIILEFDGRTELLMGPLPDPIWEYSTAGIFNVVVQAYHTRIINDQAVHQTRKYGQNLTDEEENVRYYQRRTKNRIIDPENVCSRYFKEKQAYWKAAGNFMAAINYLYNDFDEKKIIPQCLKIKPDPQEYQDNVLQAYNAALFTTLLQIDLMVDFDRYTVNGRKTRWEAPFGPLHRMLRDTWESLNAIEQGLQKLKRRRDEATQDDVERYWQRILDTFEAKLVSPPYNQLYGGGGLIKSIEIIESARKVWEELKTATVKFREYRSYFQYYKLHLKEYKADFQSPKLEVFYTLVKSVYNKYLHVERIKSGTSWDPDWAFDMSKPLHKLRVGWDYLDRVAEEMKCYLRTTYWFDLRNETLEKTQSQFKKGRVFGHFSRTLYQPCRETDTNIVAQCNPVNHEICMPSFPTIQQEKYIQLTGDRSMYRPKWIYRRTETDPPGIGCNCTGERTWIIPQKLCRCGFRDDCGSDIGVELTCPLQENDNLRKQCKGSVGYPCKSLPFAPGRHDISCVTGYCDMAMNSCEWDPPSSRK